MPGDAAGLPLALAAVSVDGRCRERNPADQGIFGAAGDRLVERFADPALGQSLLARAIADGSAEADALLLTAAGMQAFRVSLWRQRGGERIRVMAGFAARPQGEGPKAPGWAAADAEPDAVLLARSLRMPLRAVLTAAETLRAAPEATEARALAADILAAGWRMMRLADDLALVARTGGGPPAPRIAEVDLARLVRRLLRLIGPQAGRAGIALAPADLPERGAGPLVLGDEGLLWSVIEALLLDAIGRAGREGRVALALRAPEAGVMLEIRAQPGPAGAPASEPGGFDPARCREMAEATGASLSLMPAPGGGMIARLGFAAGRCLDPA